MLTRVPPRPSVMRDESSHAASRFELIGEETLAVVVSFNGGESIGRTIHALLGQVGHVHIVDNGSAPESLAVLRTLEALPGVTVERLGTNRGVGCALNRGVARAKATGHKWLLTMDQDSVIAPDMIQAYAREVSRDPTKMFLAPTLTDHTPLRAEKATEIGSAITSGNLIRLVVFDAVGGYDESFFIDGIDFDFSLRVRQAGYKLYRVTDARMQHRLGDDTALPRLVRRFYAQHAAPRRYYMTRNTLYLAERYLHVFPGFVFKLAVVHLIHLILVGLLDPEPAKNYRAVGRGVLDFISRKHGPYVNTTA